MASSQVKKPRKKRKPMTPEQRQAAAERLAKAREKRLKENPPQNLSLHESLRDLPDDHNLHPKKIREWIKTQKDLRSSYQKQARQNVKGALAIFYQHDGYIKNMEYYLRNGEWMDLYYGEYQEKKINYKCAALAYYHTGKYDGMVKRSVGVYYPDLGCMWTAEMNNEYYK
jgi:hypothetical protein